MKPFRIPEESIGALDASTAAKLVAASCDVALALDRAGVIEDLAIGPAQLALELDGFVRWVGQAWADTVAPGGEAKIEAMLGEAEASLASSWRQLSHPTTAGREVAILYSVVKIGAGERFVAFGRDMRGTVAMQQRLMDAQMSMERDYAKLRLAETRYRLLFQTSSEPTLIVDGTSHRVMEANPAAAELLDGAGGGRRAVGRPLGELFAPDARAAVGAFLAELRGTRNEGSLRVELAGAGAAVLSAVGFRAEGATLLLLRLSRGTAPPRAADAGGAASTFADLAAALPDALVVADGDGRVLAANPAFGEMAGVRDTRALDGASLERWLGRPGVDFDLMMANLRQHRTLRLFSTVLRGEGGGETDVELSAVALGDGKAASFGFALRDVGRRLKAPARSAIGVPRSADQLAGLIGRVSLKEIVRETTDVIEKLCIETALEITGDNRASAAEVLGLSRQSLYVKLRRFGLADSGAEDGP